jgi:hypothetical protein
MGTKQVEKKWLIGAVFCFILPSVLTLMCLAGGASAYSERQVCFQNLLIKPVNLDNSEALPERSERPAYLSLGLHKALLVKLAASHWWPSNLSVPLPSASVFAMQTNLCKYVNEWPTPGLTASPDPALEPMIDEELIDDDLM